MKKYIRFSLFLMVFAAFLICCSACSSSGNKVSIELDTMSFWKEVGQSTITEAELIIRLGTPDKTETWNYVVSDKSYAIRTLYYENYSYNFNGDILQRISADDLDIPYTNKSDLLKIFGLKSYSNSVVTDTGSAYKVTNCGVRQFWIQIMEGGIIKSVRIDYGNVF